MISLYSRVYKAGLLKSSLSTTYGCIIGLQKLGKYAILEFIIPQLTIISERIGPFLKDVQTDNLLNNQAAKRIIFVLQKMCSPILATIHEPTDTVKDYVQKYGFLGYSLFECVVNNRITQANEKGH